MCFLGYVAQWIEHPPSKRTVVGSIPTVPVTHDPFSDRYTSSASSIITAPEITFLGTARNDSAGGFSFPSLTGSNKGRFGPNFQFQVISTSVPEPSSSLGLLALGTLGAASTLKRKLKPSKSAEKETTKVG